MTPLLILFIYRLRLSYDRVEQSDSHRKVCIACQMTYEY